VKIGFVYSFHAFQYLPFHLGCYCCWWHRLW